METVYKKVGRKYVACGINDHMRFENGNWLLIVNGNATSYVKVSDGANLECLAAEKTRINKLCEVAGRKKNPDIMWSRTTLTSSKPIKLTPKQKEANDAFCKAFKTSAVWTNSGSLYNSVEQVVKQAIIELKGGE